MSDVILFDLDGTLTDSGPGITRCVQYALQSFGIEEPDLKKLECFVGPPLKESFMKYGGLDDDQAEKAVEKYRERYQDTGIFENEVYEGIPELLQFLKERGKILAVASSKPEVYVERILEHFQLRDYFTVVSGAELDGRRTKKAEVIEEALRRLGCSRKRQNVVMVGDRLQDVEGASSCGLLCVGAAYGYGGREELETAGAARVCDTVEELRILADDLGLEKKRKDHIRRMRPDRTVWLGRNESDRNVREEERETGQSEGESTEPLGAEEEETDIHIPFRKKAWRIVKPVLTYECCLIGASIFMALILMLFAGPGDLTERMYRTSVLVTAIAGVIAIPFLWKQLQGDEGMFPEMERCWDPLHAVCSILLVMTFGHLLNTLMNVSGFTAIFSGYEQMAENIYEGQNPILLILSVGVLSAVAEELVFRGMIYRRAKDFWGFRWGMAVSCLLFGIYHGNVVQFVYASLISILLILIYEKTGTLLGPILAHIAENVWGLYRRSLMNFLAERSSGAVWVILLLEAVLCAVSFWYLFLRKEADADK
ncbi:MAG: HAD-IA family hydrolase [Fusicatenibacter sp.]|nr:HAD-IA family hydrolase [Fusicatenibacter sp.]